MPKMEEQTTGPKKYDPKTAAASAAASASGMQGVTPLTNDDIEKFEKVDGLEKVQPMQQLNTAYIGVKGDDDNLYQIDAMPEFEGIKMDVAAGSTDVTDEDTIFMAYQYLDVLNLGTPEEAIGKTVQIAINNAASKTGEQKVFDAKISAVLNDSIVSGGTSEISQHLSKKMIEFQNEGLPESMTDMYMMVYGTVSDGATPDDVKAKIKDLGFRARTMDDMIGKIRSVIDAITYVLIAFSLIALLAAAFGIINTLYMSVSERTREIGLMKALGMSSSKVFAMFSAEAIMIGVWGSVVAVAAAVIAGNVINHIASNGFLKDLTGFTLMQYPAHVVLSVSGLIIAIAFLSGTLPSGKASRQNPIDALRYE
jgi:putative ABC transport system permease protein